MNIIAHSKASIIRRYVLGVLLVVGIGFCGVVFVRFSEPGHAKYDIDKAVEVLRRSIEANDQIKFSSTFDELLLHISPYDTKTLTAAASNPKVVVWYKLRLLLPLAFANGATFAVAELLEQNIDCVGDTSFSRELIQAVGKSNDAPTIQNYVNSSCMGGGKFEQQKILTTLIQAESWEVLSELNYSRFSALNFTFYTDIIGRMYSQNKMDAFQRLISVPVFKGAMYKSETANLVFVALQKEQYDLVEIVLKNNAINPKLRRLLLDRWLVQAVVAQASNDFLNEIVQWRESNTLDKDVVANTLRAISFSKQSDGSATRLVKYIVARASAQVQIDGYLQQTLREAVKHGFVLLTTYLLKEGVNPNMYWTVETLFDVADENGGKNTPQLVALLKEFGTNSNVLDTILQQRKGQVVEACAFAQKKPLAETIFRAQTTKRQGLKACGEIAKRCVVSGFHIEDCIRSAPSCDTKNTGAACCSSDSQQRFVAFHCAGLTVHETLRLLNM